MNVARLLFPAIRWDAATGFSGEGARIDEALHLGVGGFILFGGTAQAVRDLTTQLQSRSRHPLLIAADLERGAGQQFVGATPLPPLAALGALDDLDRTRRAGALTAREARALGVNWVYAPVADIDLEPNNPIVGTRSFGNDASLVARHVRAWIRGCGEGGALACAKHFPGHGRTTADSHAELPRVDATAAELQTDLEPFRAAIDAGVDSMMTAHVSYPALDASGAPATLSPSILTRLARENLEFEGLLVTDALNMAGVLEDAHDEGTAAIRALAAGCDALLYPEELPTVLAALENAPTDQLPRERIAQALSRIEAAVGRVASLESGSATALDDHREHEHTAATQTIGWGGAADLAWATNIAVETVRVIRGTPRVQGNRVQVFTIDDDLGGPFPAPSRDRFVDALRGLGVDARPTGSPNTRDPLIVAIYCDIRAWKGRPGLSAAAVATAHSVVHNDAVVMLFGHPRLAGADLPGDHVAAAWGGEWLMQVAAARWLVQQNQPPRDNGIAAPERD